MIANINAALIVRKNAGGIVVMTVAYIIIIRKAKTIK
jgi:hypothetical protein